MLTLDRKRGQSLLLVHRGEQCLIKIARTHQSSVRLQFVGDTFRFMRSEQTRVLRIAPGLRVMHRDNTIVEWN